MYYLIVYSSVTFANRIKNHFQNDGDYIVVLHTPAGLSEGGCSYSVKVKPAKVGQVLRASGEYGFKIKGVFRQTEEGAYAEVTL
ncbi:MAG: DUF3343 domain-containing protein [Clostridiales bacterium]|jgi:hypothetical protein|nr:DUF3343 domain-containing protein [Clostridiales bacterium]